jgi:hypothetical protein
MESSPHPKDEEKECMVAYAAHTSDGTEINLERELNLDQLRALCRKVGCNYVNSKSKFACRKALYIMHSFNERMQRDGTVALTADERMTNNIVRITNVIFSNDFLDPFLSLNDIKSRADHESGNIPKQFWTDVSDAFNCPDEEDNTASQLIIDDEDPHASELKELEIEMFDTMSSEVIKKKVFAMLKVRKQVQQNMVQSGEHDNDAYNFMDVAIKKSATGQSLTKLGCYYFFIRCENHKEVDEKFVTDVEDSIKGNSDELKQSQEPSMSAQKEESIQCYYWIARCCQNYC